MTDPATLRFGLFGFLLALLKGCFNETKPLSSHEARLLLPYDIYMLVVWKRDIEFRHRSLRFRRGIEDFGRIGERMPAAITRRRIDVTDRADGRLCPSEELLAMTIQT